MLIRDYVKNLCIEYKVQVPENTTLSFLLTWLSLCTYQLFSLYFMQDSFIHAFISAIFYHCLTILGLLTYFSNMHH